MASEEWVLWLCTEGLIHHSAVTFYPLLPPFLFLFITRIAFCHGSELKPVIYVDFLSFFKEHTTMRISRQRWCRCNMIIGTFLMCWCIFGQRQSSCDATRLIDTTDMSHVSVINPISMEVRKRISLFNCSFN